MKLSIIIPCFNSSQNINSLLDSIDSNVCNYNLHSDVEVIAIDDGSFDDTFSILREKSKSLKYLKVFSFDNAGAAITRERGIDLSCGQYIFFCDSDDIITSDFFSFFKYAYGNDIIYFSSDIVDKDHNDKVIYKKVSFDTDQYFYSGHSLLHFLLAKGQWTAAVWTYIFKREILTSSQAKFTNRKAHEDHLFTLSILLNSKKIFCVKDVFYKQIITPGSLTSRISFDYVLERYSAFKEARLFINNQVPRETKFLYDKWSYYSIFRLVKSIDSCIFRKIYLLAYFFISDPGFFFRFFIYKLSERKD